MTQGIVRARMVGAAVAVLAFAAGAATDRLLRPNVEGGVIVRVVTTDQMPAELERLGLSPAQRDRILTVLRRGRDRVATLLERFAPSMQAAADSTDVEIRPILDPAQRERFDSFRRANPVFRRTFRQGPE